MLAFAFRDGDRLVLTFEFWREEHLREHPEHASIAEIITVPDPAAPSASPGEGAQARELCRAAGNARVSAGSRRFLPAAGL